MEFCDLEEQKKHADVINSLCVDYYCKEIDEMGGLYDISRPRGLLNFLMLSEAFLAKGGQYLSYVEKLLIGQDYHRDCTFGSFVCISQLIRYQDILTSQLITKYEEHMAHNLPRFLDQEHDFIGVNDNTPALIMAFLLLYGERYHHQDAVRIGKNRLDQMKDMMQRRGFISEYNSPTYSAITICAFAALSTLSEDEKVKSIALDCEINLWRQFFLLYHRDTYQAAGPYSRSYIVDSTLHTNGHRYLIYAMLGERAKINPINTTFATKYGFEGMVQHGDPFFVQVGNAWIANMEYHCPKEYITEALERTYPVIVRGDAEVSASADIHMAKGLDDLYLQDNLYEYQASVVNLYSYINHSYAMGTSDREFHNGVQTDSFHIAFSKGGKANSQADISSMFARVIINNQFKNKDFMIPDGGRVLSMQHKNTAVCLYHPKYFKEEISSIKLSTIIYNYFEVIDEVRCGTRIIYKNEIRSLGKNVLTKGIPIFIRCGEVYIMLQPLCEDAQTVIEKQSDFICLSFEVYEGEEKIFPGKQLCLMKMGFVCEVRNMQEVGSFDSFIDSMQNIEIKDIQYANIHTRFAVMREVSYKREGLLMEAGISPLSEGIKYMAINKEAVRNIKLEVD